MHSLKEWSKATRYIYITLLFSSGLAILLYCFRNGISGNDFWWHIKVGEWICENRAVPHKDIFSWYGMSHDFEWTAHEWLSEIIYWLLYKWSGEGGIFLFSVGSAILMLLLLLWRIRRYLTDNCLITAFYICLFCVLMSLFFYGRPHVFSFYLLYGELYCLYEYTEGRRKWCIYLIPILACLWSNLHGGYANLSYLLILLVILSGIRKWRIGRIYSNRWKMGQLIQLLVIMLLTIGTVCFNPAGYRILIYPYVNLTDPVAMNAISEWAAPDAKNIGQLVLYFFPILLMSSGILLGRQAVKLRDVVLMLLFLFLFFRSVRFIVLFYISAAFWAFPYQLPCRLKDIDTTVEKILVAGLELLLVFMVGFSVRGCLAVWKQGELITETLDKQVIELVIEDAPERLFNDYNYGGSLIFYEIPVFVDERADLYAQDHLLADCVSLMLLQQANSSAGTERLNVEALVEQYDFDAFLIGTNRPLYSYLASHEDRYEAVYVSENTAYYQKRNQQQ